MPKKVLIFESDPAFAAELTQGLKTLGCDTSVVDDANIGLQAAATTRPDLILLSIELPRMNGFSVCNKLKRDPTLKDVPLVIMSSDSTEETFEQHRRLRTRAEDYVHKPVSFDALLARIEAFVELRPAGAPATSELEVNDDEIVIDDADVEIDNEVDSFTEQAFGALIEPTHPPAAEAKPSTPPAKPSAVPPPKPSAAPLAPEPALSFPSPPAEASVPAPRSYPGLGADLGELAATRVELERAKEKIRELDESLTTQRAQISKLEDDLERASAHEREAQRLGREVEELQKKVVSSATGKGAGSAREFLDLREALNKKDKEILDLRDEVTHRDKELLGLRDNSLALEREKADLDDRVAELERQLSETQRQAEASRADKEQAAKRADDFKRKSEKYQSELEARNRELSELKDQHAAEVARRDAIEAQLRAEHAQSLEQAAEQLRSSVAEAEERGRQNVVRAIAETRAAVEEEAARALDEARAMAEQSLARALADREEQLRGEFDERLIGVNRAHDDALAKLRAEHEQFAREAADREGKLLTERDALNRLIEDTRGALEQLRADKAAAEAERDARIAALEGELAARTGERDDARHVIEERDRSLAGLQADLRERTEERDAARQTIEARERVLAARDADISRLRGELDGARQELAGERERVERLRHKWTQDRASLDGAKNALAAALARIEETESRPAE